MTTLLLTILPLLTPTLAQQDPDFTFDSTPTALVPLLASISSLSAAAQTDPAATSISGFFATQTAIPSLSIASQVEVYAESIANGVTDASLPFITALPEELRGPASEIAEQQARVLVDVVEDVQRLSVSLGVESSGAGPTQTAVSTNSNSMETRVASQGTGVGAGMTTSQTASGLASSGLPANSANNTLTATSTANGENGQTMAPESSPPAPAPSSGVGKVVVGWCAGAFGAVIGAMAVL
ncbi:MAG: hypothetical protein Q9164_006647 [Protoblastenia rupestris]